MKTQIRYWATPESYPGDMHFRVHGLGIHDQAIPQVVSRPDGVEDWWLLALFYQDTAVMVAEGDRTCPRHGLVIWPPGGHRYGCADRNWSYSWLLCAGAMIPGIVGENRIPVRQILALSAPAPIEEGLRLLHAEVHRHRPPDPVIQRNLFENMIREVRREIRPDPQARVVPGRILDAKAHIDSHFAERLTLDGMARHAGLSVPHFSREFRRCFRTSPVDYLIRLRMTRAQALLMDEHLNITEVAAMVGYDRLFHFSRLFRKHYGQTPRDLRRAWRQARTSNNG